MEDRATVRRMLDILAQIKPGQTLCAADMTIVEHNTWYTSFKRRWNGEERSKTVQSVKDIFSQATHLITSGKAFDLMEQLEAALEGVENLKKTYSSDTTTISALNEYCSSTRRALNCVQKEYSKWLEERSVTTFSFEEFSSDALPDIIQHRSPSPIDTSITLYSSAARASKKVTPPRSDLSGTFDLSTVSTAAPTLDLDCIRHIEVEHQRNEWVDISETEGTEGSEETEKTEETEGTEETEKTEGTEGTEIRSSQGRYSRCEDSLELSLESEPRALSEDDIEARVMDVIESLRKIAPEALSEDLLKSVKNTESIDSFVEVTRSVFDGNNPTPIGTDEVLSYVTPGSVEEIVQNSSTESTREVAQNSSAEARRPEIDQHCTPQQNNHSPPRMNSQVTGFTEESFHEDKPQLPIDKTAHEFDPIMRDFTDVAATTGSSDETEQQSFRENLRGSFDKGCFPEDNAKGETSPYTPTQTEHDSDHSQYYIMSPNYSRIPRETFLGELVEVDEESWGSASEIETMGDAVEEKQILSEEDVSVPSNCKITLSQTLDEAMGKRENILSTALEEAQNAVSAAIHQAENMAATMVAQNMSQAESNIARMGSSPMYWPPPFFYSLPYPVVSIPSVEQKWEPAVPANVQYRGRSDPTLFSGTVVSPVERTIDEGTTLKKEPNRKRRGSFLYEPNVYVPSATSIPFSSEKEHSGSEDGRKMQHYSSSPSNSSDKVFDDSPGSAREVASDTIPRNCQWTRSSYKRSHSIFRRQGSKEALRRAFPRFVRNFIPCCGIPEA